MSKTILAGLALSALTLLAGPPTAQAAPITYNLHGVTFTDGATASGYINYDADTKKSAGFNVSTTAGILSAFTFDTSDSGFYSGGGVGPNNFILFTNDGKRYFNFSFLDPLTDAGGTMSLNTASSYECNNCGTFRMVTAGSVDSVNVPEPASSPLVLLGLGVLALIARPKKHVALRA